MGDIFHLSVSEVVQTLQLCVDGDQSDVVGDLSVCLDGMVVDPEMFATAEANHHSESIFWSGHPQYIECCCF